MPPTGATTACQVSLPVTSPNFSRSNGFKEGAVYVQDAWKVRPRVTVNLGLRWEHFGVQHNRNASLDSTWYAPSIGFADSNLGQYLRTGSIQLAPQSTIGNSGNPTGMISPRASESRGMSSAMERRALRGGYGIGTSETSATSRSI